MPSLPLLPHCQQQTLTIRHVAGHPEPHWFASLNCFKIFPHQVINTGISMAPNVSVEIMVPNAFVPQTDKLFNVLDVQVKMSLLSDLYSVCPKY